ncbi:hypothetical protein FEM48_Zijuj04G0046700 [Ziziphus jujuba var. spinosa]|uniref:Cystathionine gamma-synthase 1, chloroplastic-like n=1 Tax=Ziziphus jujuba var. spinosa TaxID=714518 RepID=A0A978VHV1_ZIZJJ|nr:hypothetical protein FEM48_Zijuj04G0046700 [Ziziphus jujuba var. spinosa]
MKTRIYIEEHLSNKEIMVTAIDPADVEALESELDNNKVSLLTSSAFQSFATEIGALVCIDGSLATPLNRQAVALGADLVLHSATKYIGGHNDVLAGCISGPLKLVTEIRKSHYILVGTLNPNAAYLIIRGPKTLHLRVKQQNSTPLRMAKILEAHPKNNPYDILKKDANNAIRFGVGQIVASHPQHELAIRQMTGFGGVVSSEPVTFVDAMKIRYIAPSFGGCESLVNQPAIMDVPRSERLKYGIKDNLVTFLFGVEDFEDLKAIILQALMPYSYDYMNNRL